MTGLSNTRKYLLYTGLLLLVATLLGNMGLGPTPQDSILGFWLYFDPAENLLHFLFGLIALTGFVVLRSDRALRVLSAILGIVALVAVVLTVLDYQQPMPNIGLINMEWVDAILHALVAAWGFWVAFMPEGPMFIREPKTASQQG